MSHVDREYQDRVRALPCLGCGAEPPSECHHVKTRGAGGGDHAWNLMPLCTNCHYEWHFTGPSKFLKKRPWVREYLAKLGWKILGAKLFAPVKEETDDND